MKTNGRKYYFDNFEFGDDIWSPEFEELSDEHPIRSRIEPRKPIEKSKKTAGQKKNNT